MSNIGKKRDISIKILKEKNNKISHFFLKLQTTSHQTHSIIDDTIYKYHENNKWFNCLGDYRFLYCLYQI